VWEGSLRNNGPSPYSLEPGQFDVVCDVAFHLRAKYNVLFCLSSLQRLYGWFVGKDYQPLANGSPPTRYAAGDEGSAASHDARVLLYIIRRKRSTSLWRVTFCREMMFDRAHLDKYW